MDLAERVLLAGFVPDAAKMLGPFDVFVLPSLAEGTPVAAIEAMQAGVPVVAGAVGGVPELLESGHAGVLVPPGDVAALADALGTLEADVAQRREIAQRAQRAVASRLSSGEMARRYLEIYRSMIGRNTDRS